MNIIMSDNPTVDRCEAIKCYFDVRIISCHAIIFIFNDDKCVLQYYCYCYRYRPHYLSSSYHVFCVFGIAQNL